MSPYLLAVLLSLPVIAASLAGGWLPNVLTFTHTQKQVFIGFISGFMITVSLLHLLPHGIEQIASVHTDSAVQFGVICTVAGIVVMFSSFRLLSFHDHEPESAPNDSQLTTMRVSRASWITVFAGMSMHTLFEGFALGSSLSIEHGMGVGHDAEAHVHTISLTILVVLAIVFHKPLDALTVIGVMKHGGVDKKNLWLSNIGFALICPIGALLSLFFLRELLHDYEHILGFLLAFIAGVFLCVALADLLPEAFRHRHDRVKIFIAFLGGVLLTFVYWLITPHVH